MKTWVVIFSFTGVLGCSCSNKNCVEEREGLTILHLAGSPFERGMVYGKFMKKEIHETIGRWEEEVERKYQEGLENKIDEFFSTTNFPESLKKHDPDLLKEVAGMAESTGIEVRKLLAFQMSEEMFTLLGGDPGSNCTAIGFNDQEHGISLLAQNMDPPLFLHGHPLVLHIIPDGGDPECLVFTVPGLLGMAGMNEAGIGITCNGLSMLNHSCDGLPVVSVVRKVLSSVDYNSASSFVENAVVAIPQCYTVGGKEGLRCFECSANEISEFYPFEDIHLTLHTNFSIRNSDFNQKYVELLNRYNKTVEDPYFCPRYFHVYDMIEEYGRNLDAQKIRTILRLNAPDPEPILNQYTLGTLLMELDDNPVLYLATGQNEKAPFQKISF